MSKSILNNNEKCFLTGSNIALEKHHVMNGSGVRSKAEHDGLWVYLTHYVHRWIHDTGSGAEFAKHMKAQAQHAYEKKYSHEQWMRRYKKDYSSYYDENISEVYRNWDK